VSAGASDTPATVREESEDKQQPEHKVSADTAALWAGQFSSCTSSAAFILSKTKYCELPLFSTQASMIFMQPAKISGTNFTVFI
jgi:hypothetical protein